MKLWMNPDYPLIFMKNQKKISLVAILTNSGILLNEDPKKPLAGR